MIRVITSVAAAAALIAAGALWAGDDLLRRNPLVASLGIGSPATVATEAWPICSAMTALGTESDWAELDPDFAAGKKALAAEDWRGAIAALRLAALLDPRNADIQNYIGYAYRRLGELGPAMGHYQQALMFNPRHRSAREHLGELYLSLDEPDKAEEQRAALSEICLIGCDEVSDLDRAIMSYRAMVRRSKAARLF
jgi:Flp pilus assembly protein TadD